MTDTIFELLKFYSSKEKIIDQNFIEELKKTIISLNNLEEYIKTITLTEEHNKFCFLYGDYSFNQKAINLYITYSSYLERTFKKGLFYDFEYYFYTNAKIVWLLLHEIEHGNHIKLYQEDKNDLLTKIIKPCIEISNGILPLLIPFSKEELDIWFDYYHDSFLDERLADISALSTILKVLETDKDLFPTLYPYTKNTFYNFLLRGYKENTNPLENFFTIIKYPNLYDDILEFEKNNPIGNDIITKMSFGFPVSSTDYQRMRKKRKNSYYENDFDLFHLF